MARRLKHHSLLRTGALLWLLLAAVIVPALLSLAVGIIALVLWRAPFDIVFGVLVLCFAAMVLTGGVLSMLYLRRTARLAEMQTDFIANVSHELRTPLAGIRLLVETLTLGRAPAPEQRNAVLNRLAAEVHRLEDLVARILSWRRLESGAAVLQREPLQLAPLVEEAVAAVLAQTTAGPAPRLEVDLAAELPPIDGDREALLAALRNLLHNAIKFGADRGPVRIEARGVAGEVVVAVRDQGPGIPPSERKRIFERFYRVPAHDPARQGTGLGLAIVRRVVQGHRGRLRVESEQDAGTTFTMHLPVGRAARRGGPR
ncbi:MAG: sensor histidine kinase [Proteobacteria bacterium]|nr:sensor histidine kinase [Pseudomonadota bacterium]